MELVLGLMTGFNVIEDNAFALLKEQLLCTIIHYMVKSKLCFGMQICIVSSSYMPGVCILYFLRNSARLLLLL